MSIADQLMKEYYRAVEIAREQTVANAEKKGEFIGYWTATTIVEGEFKEAEKKGMVDWLAMIALFIEMDRTGE